MAQFRFQRSGSLASWFASHGVGCSKVRALSMALFSSKTTMFGRDFSPSIWITCSRRSSRTRFRTSPAAVPTLMVTGP